MKETTTKQNTKLQWSTEFGSWSLNLQRPLIMSIINLTPDSFSDGGRFENSRQAVEAALAEEADGADIFDLGAESTRPGSPRVEADEEWNRLEPVLLGIKSKSRKPISIDTYKASVAEKALKSGAAIINDVYAGRKEPDILKVAADYSVPIILMHMQGEPGTMQVKPHYEDVVQEVHNFLQERALEAEKAGVKKEHIILDPGIGFGKNKEHNLTLLKHFDKVMPQGYLSLMALSRKRFLGSILNDAPPLERDGITAIASTLSILRGAAIVRVHRAKPSREAIDLLQALDQV